MPQYEYANARLRAMKSRMLPRAGLVALAEVKSLESLLAALERTPYCQALAAAQGRGRERLHATLCRDLSDTLVLVQRLFGREEWELASVFSRPFDIGNLKAVLRGLATGTRPEKIAKALLPVGELEASVLDELSRLPSLRAAVERLAALRLPPAAPLIALHREQPGASLAEMELALERWHHERARRYLLRAEDGVQTLTAALDLEADLANLVALLRSLAVRERRPLGQRQLVGPGRLPFELLERVSRQATLPEAVSLFKDSPYGPALAAGRLSDIERQLRLLRLRWLAALITRDPLGIGVLLGYLALKTSEVRNLRWIVEGVGLGLPPAAIGEELEMAA